MLFDEVATDLDLETKAILINYLRKHSKENKKIIIWVTHNLDELDNFSNKFILFADAAVKKMGSLKSIDYDFLSKELKHG